MFKAEVVMRKYLSEIKMSFVSCFFNVKTKTASGGRLFLIYQLKNPIASQPEEPQWL